MTGDVLAAALDYAKRGWHVFPVRGKRPALDLVPQWSEASTTDPAVIASWYAGSTGLGVAVDLGPSGLVVADVDHPDRIPPDWPDLTGWAYRGNPERASFLYRRNGTPIPQAVHPWGEVKAAGGYVVLPPSPHPSGVTYTWLDNPDAGDPPTLPADLADLVAPARPNVPTGEPWTPDRTPTDDEVDIVVDHFARWLAIVGATPPSGGRYGGRNRALFVASVVAGHLCPHYLDPDRAAAALAASAEECGLVADDGRRSVEATIRSGLRTGMAEPQAVPRAATAEPDDTASSWKPRPLLDAVAAEGTGPAATILRPGNGPRGCFYTGLVSTAYGEPGTGKTWVLVAALADVLRSGPAQSTVTIVDLEDRPGLWEDRLRQVGMTTADLRRVSYNRPRERLDAESQLDDLAPNPLCGLVVVDGLTTLYRLHGLDIDSATDTDRVFGWLARVADHGPAVVATDHVTKSREARRFAIGSQHKLSAVNGVAYTLDTPRGELPPARGHAGHVGLTLAKDREGGVPCRQGELACWVTVDDRAASTGAPSTLTVDPAAGWQP